MLTPTEIQTAAAEAASYGYSRTALRDAYRSGAGSADDLLREAISETGTDPGTVSGEEAALFWQALPERGDEITGVTLTGRPGGGYRVYVTGTVSGSQIMSSGPGDGLSTAQVYAEMHGVPLSVDPAYAPHRP